MRLAAAAIAVLGTACLDAPPHSTADPGPPDARAQGDGAAPADAGLCAAGDWSDAEPVAELAGVDVTAPTVSGGEVGALLIYIDGGDLAVATWNGESFDLDPAPIVSALNTAGAESGPTLSASGLTLWFLRDSLLRVSKREPSGVFETDSAVAGYEETPLLGPEVDDSGSAISMYFSLVDGATPDAIYRADCSDPASCGAPTEVVELDAAGQERFPTLRSDGGEIVFRSSSVSSLVSYRRDDPDLPFDGRTELNVDAEHPELAFGGRVLFFVVGDDLYAMSRPCQ